MVFHNLACAIEKLALIVSETLPALLCNLGRFIDLLRVSSCFDTQLLNPLCIRCYEHGVRCRCCILRGRLTLAFFKKLAVDSDLVGVEHFGLLIHVQDQLDCNDQLRIYFRKRGAHCCQPPVESGAVLQEVELRLVEPRILVVLLHVVLSWKLCQDCLSVREYLFRVDVCQLAITLEGNVIVLQDQISVLLNHVAVQMSHELIVHDL
mmetsp:Transcript_3542/g.5827  ORF Transcript_3542/g.5827 Transcript_3542/m.5827 type:complete len:207 (+) Transcript_3542:902-1522(+)